VSEDPVTIHVRKYEKEETSDNGFFKRLFGSVNGLMQGSTNNNMT
jgi:hypothetical protein